ncbi:hypothetical protein H5410_042846 [Solanum commersonii]|uniref:Uncharacterized protein n=1 Tax=Solanum commersonii TaxID=4109 RepID=A0A9J5XYU9_SOLCO|nr:hypothetical protein H5410_042846 [Solanum commersonii]
MFYFQNIGRHILLSSYCVDNDTPLFPVGPNIKIIFDDFLLVSGRLYNMNFFYSKIRGRAISCLLSIRKFMKIKFLPNGCNLRTKRIVLYRSNIFGSYPTRYLLSLSKFPKSFFFLPIHETSIQSTAYIGRRYTVTGVHSLVISAY